MRIGRCVFLRQRFLCQALPINPSCRKSDALDKILGAKQVQQMAASNMATILRNMGPQNKKLSTIMQIVTKKGGGSGHVPAAGFFGTDAREEFLSLQ